jgi:cytochrome c oxidase subunit 2
LAPHSPGTDQISALLWIGYAAGALVVVLVNGGLLYALRRRRGRAGGDGEGGSPAERRRGQLRVGAALGLFAAALLVLGVVYTERARRIPQTGPAGLQAARSKPLVIEATGQQWLWRYSYPNEAFSYYRLVVPVDTTVELDLVSTDVVHSWDVPDLAGKAEAVPGKVNRVVFRADREGDYFGQSATLSGQAYATMRTAVRVVSPAEYEEFTEDQKEAAQAAQDRVVHLLESGQAP